MVLIRKIILVRKRHIIFSFLSTLIMLVILVNLFNSEQFVRQVFIRLNNDSRVIKKGAEDQKIIALTFDDGPHPRFTPLILDLLKEYEAKATFFVLGKHAQMYPEVIERLAKEGHEIGNHTYSHIDVNNSSYGKIKKELEDTQNTIYSIIGKKPKLFRPPYGFINDRTLQIAEDNGCKVILWSQDPRDWNSPKVDRIVTHILSNIENGNIILLHDYVPEKDSNTVEALRIMLPKLINEGFRFVTISEFVEILNLD